MIATQTQNKRDDSCRNPLSLRYLAALGMLSRGQHVETGRKPHRACRGDVKEAPLLCVTEAPVSFRDVQHHTCCRFVQPLRVSRIDGSVSQEPVKPRDQFQCLLVSVQRLMGEIHPY